MSSEAHVFDQVPTFVAVVETGSFASAAERLHVSRSAVAKSVARLEHQLGTRLLHRTTRSHSLTDDGQAFYERCQRALDELRAGKSQIESGRTGAVGRLRVSMPVLFGRLYAAPALIKLAAMHPHLELALDFRDRHVDMIDEYFDLVIRNGPLGNTTGLAVQHLMHARTELFASPDYLGRNGTPRNPDDLSGCRAIVYARDGRVEPWQFPRPRQKGLTFNPDARIALDDMGAIADAAAAGHGLAWLPHWLVSDHVASGTLVKVFPRRHPLTSDVHAVWPESPHVPTRVRLAVKALADALAS